MGGGLADPPLGARGTQPHKKQTAEPYLCWKVLDDFNQVLAALCKGLVHRVGFQAGLGDRADQSAVSTLLGVRPEVQATGRSHTRKARVIPTRKEKALCAWMKVSRKGQASPRERKAPAVSTQGWGPQRLGQRRDPAVKAGAGSAAFRGTPGRPCSQINTHRKAQAWHPSRAGAFRLSPTARSSEPLAFMQRFTRRDDAGVHSSPLSPPAGETGDRRFYDPSCK